MKYRSQRAERKINPCVGKKTLKPRLRALSELRNFSVPMLSKQSGHPLGRCLRHNTSKASLPLLSIRRLFSDALACYRNVQCAIRDAGEALFTVTKKKKRAQSPECSRFHAAPACITLRQCIVITFLFFSLSFLSIFMYFSLFRKLACTAVDINLTKRLRTCLLEKKKKE